MPRELRRFMQLSLLQMLRRSKSRGTCSIARRGGLRCCAARKHATRIANGEIWLQTDALSSLIMMTVQMRMRRTTMSRSLLIHFIRVVSTQVSTILGTRGDPEKIIAKRASAARRAAFSEAVDCGLGPPLIRPSILPFFPLRSLARLRPAAAGSGASEDLTEDGAAPNLATFSPPLSPLAPTQRAARRNRRQCGASACGLTPKQAAVAAAATEASCASVSSASLRSPHGHAPSGASVHAGSMPPAHVLCRLRRMDAITHKQQQQQRQQAAHVDAGPPHARW